MVYLKLAKKNWTVKRHEFDRIGRLGMIEIEQNETDFILFGIHGPATRRDDEDFLKQLDNRLTRTEKNKKKKNIIIAGNFYATTDAFDSTTDESWRQDKKQ